MSREQDMSRQGGEVSVIQQLVSQIDVFLSLVSWSPLVTVAAL